MKADIQAWNRYVQTNHVGPLETASLNFKEGFAAAVELVEQRLLKAKERTRQALDAARACNHPDDLATLAATFKAAAARENILEDLLYTLTEEDHT